MANATRMGNCRRCMRNPVPDAACVMMGTRGRPPVFKGGTNTASTASTHPPPLSKHPPDIPYTLHNLYHTPHTLHHTPQSPPQPPPRRRLQARAPRVRFPHLPDLLRPTDGSFSPRAFHYGAS
ncbi:hypothetical protein GWK47_033746 [Chionoecetes opilio]|uniref:Uncharacterized protein n=1 Tax=Chionoecetes opilio TaxID=41210 RepID=A0A8J4YJI2_CHIOP|nr:hypothetical protein GWK47_033746 [Chionoecetes opilio]